MPNMSIQNRKPTNSDTKHAKDRKVIAPPTVTQRIQATRIMGYIGGALFAGFLLMSAYPIFENLRTIRVDGTVMKITSETNVQSGRIGNPRSTVYWHQFRFMDQGGVEHIADSVGRGRDSDFRVGEVVSIGYYPDDFSKVWVPTWFGLWEYQLALFGLGLVLIAYSIWGVKQIRNEAKAKS
jgi:hypothetical protein